VAVGAAEAIATLADARFVPVVRAPDAQLAIQAAWALSRGGCRAVEITFTTPGAAEAIRELTAWGMVVLAGTVLDAEMAEAALDAGALAIVSPALVPAVLACARARGALAIPGALTPTEILAARATGAGIIKVFPVASVGGPRYLQLVGDPLPGLRFFPTGGVTLADAPAYLAAGAVCVGVASALAAPGLIAAGDGPALEAAARTWADALYGTIA